MSLLTYSTFCLANLRYQAQSQTRRELLQAWKALGCSNHELRRLFRSPISRGTKFLLTQALPIAARCECDTGLEMKSGVPVPKFLAKNKCQTVLLQCARDEQGAPSCKRPPNSGGHYRKDHARLKMDLPGAYPQVATLECEPAATLKCGQVATLLCESVATLMRIFTCLHLCSY